MIFLDSSEAIDQAIEARATIETQMDLAFLDPTDLSINPDFDSIAPAEVIEASFDPDAYTVAQHQTTDELEYKTAAAWDTVFLLKNSSGEVKERIESFDSKKLSINFWGQNPEGNHEILPQVAKKYDQLVTHFEKDPSWRRDPAKPKNPFGWNQAVHRFNRVGNRSDTYNGPLQVDLRIIFPSYPLENPQGEETQLI